MPKWWFDSESYFHAASCFECDIDFLIREYDPWREGISCPCCKSTNIVERDTVVLGPPGVRGAEEEKRRKINAKLEPVRDRVEELLEEEDLLGQFLSKEMDKVIKALDAVIYDELDNDDGGGGGDGA